MRISYLAFCFLPFLAACQTTKTSLVPVETPRPQVAVPTPQPMVMRDMEWKVYNTADLERLVTDLKSQKTTSKNFVLFALTPKGYEALSENMIEIERYIREQKAVTVYLRKIIDERAGSAKQGEEEKPE